MRVITPIAMAFIFAGSVSGFFTQMSVAGLSATTVGYLIAGILLVVFFFVAISGDKKTVK